MSTLLRIPSGDNRDVWAIIQRSKILKIIAFLRSAMKEDRLNGLAHLFINQVADLLSKKTAD
jgi:hypothetical protein